MTAQAAGRSQPGALAGGAHLAGRAGGGRHGPWFHFRRAWGAIDRALTTHHARYMTVRADMHDQAEAAWVEWMSTDPVAASIPTARDETG